MTQRSHFISIAIAVVLLAGSVWLVKHHATQTPQHVFTDMLRNNLSTSGVTRVVKQSGQGVQIAQYTQLSLGARPQAHSLTVLQQGGGTLSTEEISTASSDLVRYQKINLPSGAKAKTTNIVGKWAALQSNDAAQTGLTSGLFKQSLLGTLPVANLQPNARNQLLSTIQTNGVFSYGDRDVTKTTLNEQSVYQYNVTVKSAAYILMMQQFEKLIGQSSFKDINPADYAKANPIALQISIGVRSHQLAQIYQVANKRTEQYQGFGLTDATPLPKANITTTELTKLLASPAS